MHRTLEMAIGWRVADKQRCSLYLALEKTARKSPFNAFGSRDAIPLRRDRAVAGP